MWPFRKKQTQTHIVIIKTEEKISTSCGIMVSTTWSMYITTPKVSMIPMFHNIHEASSIYQYALEAVRRIKPVSNEIVVIDETGGYREWIDRKPMRDAILEIPSHAIISEMTPK